MSKNSHGWANSGVGHRLLYYSPFAAASATQAHPTMGVLDIVIHKRAHHILLTPELNPMVDSGLMTSSSSFFHLFITQWEK